MASYTVPTGTIAAQDKQLTAGVVDTVTFTDLCPMAEVLTDGTAAVYVTFDGTTPSASAPNAYKMPAAVEALQVRPANPSAAAIKLFSAGTPVYSVSNTAATRLFASSSSVTTTGVAPVTSIAAGSSATANGTVLDNTTARANHSMIVTSSAGVSTGTVQLQGSHDNSSWFVLGTVSTTSASTVFGANSAGFPVRYLRAAITAAITGGTVTATVASATA